MQNSRDRLHRVQVQVLLQYSAVVLLGQYALLRAMPQATVRRRLRLEEEA